MDRARLLATSKVFHFIESSPFNATVAVASFFSGALPWCVSLSCLLFHLLTFSVYATDCQGNPAACSCNRQQGGEGTGAVETPRLRRRSTRTEQAAEPEAANARKHPQGASPERAHRGLVRMFEPVCLLESSHYGS